jgi:dCTP deaminase
MDESRIGKGSIITDRVDVLSFFEGGAVEPVGKYWNGWSLDLCLGDEAYCSRGSSPVDLTKTNYLCIQPGEFAHLFTRETVRLPGNAMAFISLRNSYKKRGLINVSGFHVDPNYAGKLMFSVFNAGPNDIIVKRGDRLFMIFFQRLDRTLSREECSPKISYSSIPAEDVSLIHGRSTTLADNALRLSQLEFNFKVLLAVFVSFLALMTAWIVPLLRK